MLRGFLISLSVTHLEQYACIESHPSLETGPRSRVCLSSDLYKFTRPDVNTLRSRP